MLVIRKGKYYHFVHKKKLYNDKFLLEKCNQLNFEQILTTRQSHFQITSNRNLMDVKNAITNRLQS
jgi:hypothetical protein